MDVLLTDILIGAYVATNGLRVLFYLPQMARIHRDADGASAIALSTWSFWTVSNATTSLYAAAVLHDPFLACISTANTICCALVVTMVVVKRKRPGKSSCLAQSQLTSVGAQRCGSSSSIWLAR